MKKCLRCGKEIKKKFENANGHKYCYKCFMLLKQQHKHKGD